MSVLSTQAENKWINLLTAHSAMMKSKQTKKTARKENIPVLSGDGSIHQKTHSITRPFLGGSGMILVDHNASEDSDPQPDPPTAALCNDHSDGKVQKKTFSMKASIRKQTKISTKGGNPKTCNFFVNWRKGRKLKGTNKKGEMPWVRKGTIR